MRSKALTGLLATCALGLLASAASAGTLDNVKGKGMVTCGANTGLAGFGIPDDKGNWTGLDVDVCRAMAAAVLGDATKVKFVALDAKNRFTAAAVGRSRTCSRAIRPRPRRAPRTLGADLPGR